MLWLRGFNKYNEITVKQILSFVSKTFEIKHFVKPDKAWEDCWWFIGWNWGLIIILLRAKVPHTCAKNTMCSINHSSPLPALSCTHSHRRDNKRKRDERYDFWFQKAPHTWAFHLKSHVFQWTPTTSPHSIHIYGSNVLVCKWFPTVPSQQMNLFCFLNAVWCFLS